MEQIAVEKQGSWNHRRWSQRVLSLSTLLGIAAITADGNVDDAAHRKCLHVTQVQLWPHYSRRHVREDFDSMAAKLTLRVKGGAVRLGERTVQRADGPLRVYSYTQRNAAAFQHSWMLRFATFADLERAVHLFQAIRIHHPVRSRSDASEAGAAAETAQKGGAGECAAAVVEDSDTVVADGAQRLHDDGAALTDELEPAGITPSSVLDGDVASDLQSIRSQWEQLQQRTGLQVA